MCQKEIQMRRPSDKLKVIVFHPITSFFSWLVTEYRSITRMLLRKRKQGSVSHDHNADERTILYALLS